MRKILAVVFTTLGALGVIVSSFLVGIVPVAWFYTGGSYLLLLLFVLCVSFAVLFGCLSFLGKRRRFFFILPVPLVCFVVINIFRKMYSGIGILGSFVSCFFIMVFLFTVSFFAVEIILRKFRIEE